MPELPEVETVMRGMMPAFEGRRIKRVVLNRPDLRFPIPMDLPEKLQEQKFVEFLRRGKYILAFVEDGEGIVLHLGMSGVIRVMNANEPYQPQKHDHVIFEMENGGCVVFNDARRFGFLLGGRRDEWMNTAPFLEMGPEPLGEGFNVNILYAALQKRKSPIKNVLLDQKVVAGLGNIYVCEALFRSAIHPTRAACDVNRDECEALVEAIGDVLGEAIDAGGSSLRDYRNTKGKMGYFQHHFGVYDREGKACPHCDCDIDLSGGVQRIVQGGRSSFYCARYQL